MASLSLSTVLSALAGGFLPALFWLWFWLKEDSLRPEPRLALLRTFIIGGLMIVPAYYVERLVVPYLPTVDGLAAAEGLDIGTSLLGFLAATTPLVLVWAVWEELLKWFAMAAANYKNRAFDEPVDYMVYLLTAALGFAAVENTLFLFDGLLNGGHLDGFFLLTGNLRFLGATVLHIVSSAVLGAILALGVGQSRSSRLVAGGLGLIAASTLHAGFNFFIILNGGVHFFRVLIALWFAAIAIILLFEKVKKVTGPVPVLPP